MDYSGNELNCLMGLRLLSSCLQAPRTELRYAAEVLDTGFRFGLAENAVGLFP